MYNTDAVVRSQGRVGAAELEAVFIHSHKTHLRLPLPQKLMGSLAS